MDSLFTSEYGSLLTYCYNNAVLLVCVVVLPVAGSAVPTVAYSSLLHSASVAGRSSLLKPTACGLQLATVETGNGL